MDLLANVERGAYLSKDRVYRYSLWRYWGAQSPAMFIGLNPSTADETQDDPTIRRCMNFAKSWGCGGIVMTNLFAFRATDPKLLKAATDPIGPENDEILDDVAAECEFRIACWGVHGTHLCRDIAVAGMMRPLKCFGTTKDGHPKHPLYLPKTSKLLSLRY